MTFVKVGKVQTENEGASWVQFGLPMAKGKVQKPSEINFFTDSGVALSSAIKSVSRWSDESLKWILVELISKGPVDVFLEIQKIGSEVSKADSNEDDEFHSFASISVVPSIELGVPKSIVEVDGESTESSLSKTSVLKYYVKGKPDLKCEVRKRAVPRLGFTEVAIHLCNEAPSTHPGGCWDLGDPNSVDVSQFSIDVSLKGIKAKRLENEEGADFYDLSAVDNFVLEQLSSGGPNYCSPIHLNRNNELPLRGHGYRLELNSKKYEGGRIDPVVVFDKADRDYYFKPSYFWQNFPSRLRLVGSSLIWELFPESTELQPGESKTWQFTLGHNRESAFFTPDPLYFENTEVLLGISLVTESELTRIIDLGIDGEDNFKRKRERVDEFGWRNFGELYADHEALYHSDEQDIFVSHYNNQYDPIYGFTLRWLSTKRSEWKYLASELKQHIVDIDIYKTDKDKAEYNNGLFWHTDHYLPALTATHRTYSAQHTAAYDGHQGGGGPGGQHCYTTGLALHYLLTGDEQSRETVLKLMGWVRCFYNGPESLLSRLYRFLTIDLKPGQMTNIGLVPAGYKYPLDRGTANYLNALIDGYQISSGAELLDEMFSVIRQTLSPFDDLNERQLNDIENAWFYIVFLQALARYLLLKEQLNETDEAYSYARLAFNLYANWVREREHPYLTTPEKLEFPNDTWAAQDLRKANVLYYAAYFDPDRAKEHSERAEFFWNYCVERLSVSEERGTTRVLAILMQNQGVREWQQQAGTSPYPVANINSSQYPMSGPWKRLLHDSWHIVPRFSLRTEWHWLKTRLASR